MGYYWRHIVRLCAVVTGLAVMQVFGPIAVSGERSLSGPLSGSRLGAAEVPEGVKNYFLLQKHYTSWHEGLFGSRRYHERKLRDFLLHLLGQEITTDYDFMLSSPEGLYDKTMICVFQYNRWLHIHGDLDLESVKKITGMDGAAMMGWWRSKVLVAVTGKVKNFRLDWDAQGDTVHLYLEKVTVLYNEDKK